MHVLMRTPSHDFPPAEAGSPVSPDLVRSLKSTVPPAGKPQYVILWRCAATRPPAPTTRLTPGATTTQVIWWRGSKRVADFEDVGRGLPENASPPARSADDDLDNLKRKLDAGATQAITQYFFDTSNYLRFLERCLAAGITARSCRVSCRCPIMPKPPNSAAMC